MLDMEDPDLIWDLRVNNQGRPEEFSAYLEECKMYIDGVAQTAVDDTKNGHVALRIQPLMKQPLIYD